MAEDSQDASRSIADEIGEKVLESVQTPVEIFFLALLVFGVLSIAATTLVGFCGNVDDDANFPDPRTIDYIPGATVVTTSSVSIGETVITAGACGIVDSVDKEEGTARVHILAKAQPSFVEGEYRPLSVFSSLFSVPVSSILFLHAGTPSGDVPLHQITPVATQQYTNWFRNFYLNTIYILMALLALPVVAFGYIGYRYEKKRTVWYEQHTLRATYISRLMQDKRRTRQLREQWETARVAAESGDAESWKGAFVSFEEVLDGVLILLRFEGTDLHGRLQEMTEDDLWMIDRLWEAHSVIVRMRGLGDESGDSVVITGQVAEKVSSVYKEALIWLGLLPHWA